MSKYFLGKLLSKVLPKQKTTGTEVIKNVGIAKNLTTKRNIQDQVTETVDSAFKKANAPPSIANQQKKAKLKKEEGKKLKDFSYKLDKIEDKIDKRNKASKKFFNKGGRVGLKGGTQLSAKQMKIASLAGNKKKIDGPDFKKLRAMKSPMDKTVRKV
jgi:uncharacterized protein Yka (UPF0111/DUF47 family)